MAVLPRGTLNKLSLASTALMLTEVTVVNTWFETLVFFQFAVILSIKITKCDYFIGL